MLPEWLTFVCNLSLIVAMISLIYAAWAVTKLRSELRERDQKRR